MDVFSLALQLKEEGGAIVRAATERLRSSFNQTSTAANKLDKSTNQLSDSFKRLAAQMAATYGVGQLGKMADTYINLNARLSLVTKSSEELRATQQQLFQIAQATRTPLEDIVSLYLRTANSATSLGLSQEDVIRLTDQTAKAVALSGSSAAEAAAAIQQLGQAFGNGAVQAQEWNSLAEQTPRLARAIAESFGMTTAEFRKAVLEQRVTSAELAKAILTNQKLAAEFGKLPTVIGGAFTQLRNQVLLLVGEINKGTGATKVIVDFLVWIRSNLPTIVGVIAAATTVWAGYRLTLIGVAAAKTAVGVASAFMNGNLALAAKAAAGAATAAVIFAEVYSRMNKVVKDTAAITGGAAGGAAGAGGPFEQLTLGLGKAKDESKSMMEMLVELASIAPITQKQANTMAAEYDRLTEALNAGNLSLEKRLKLETQRAAIAEAQAKATVITPAAEIAAMERRMGARIGQPIQATLGPAAITKVNPKIVEAVRQQSAKLFSELTTVYSQEWQKTQQDMANTMANTLMGSIVNAFETLASKGGTIGSAFKALTQTLLRGLGDMLIQFGSYAVATSKLMAKLYASIPTNPVAAVGVGLAMIALGASIRGAASRIFTPTTGAGGGAISAPSIGMISGNETLPGLYYGPTAAGSASTIQQMPNMNVTVIGPNDPTAQRQMQELLRNAQRRGEA